MVYKKGMASPMNVLAKAMKKQLNKPVHKRPLTLADIATIPEKVAELAKNKPSRLRALIEKELPKNIRQQSHYTQFKIQPVVFIAENNLDFLTGNVIKYVLRHGKKNGVEDLEKAKHYLDMLIQKTKGQTVVP